MDAFTELSINMSATYAKINALIASLSDEQRATFTKEFDRIKEKVAHKLNPNDDPEIASEIEKCFAIKFST